MEQVLVPIGENIDFGGGHAVLEVKETNFSKFVSLSDFESQADLVQVQTKLKTKTSNPRLGS